MSSRIFILGAGRFGTHLANRLAELGCEVVIADSDAKRVADLAERGFHAMEMDADDEAALRAADVEHADAVVVAIGENMQASILATLLLKELKVQRLVTRALDVKHAIVLQKLGADLVVLPDRDMAYRLAERLRAGVVSERLAIRGEYQLAPVRIGEKLNGKALGEIKLPQKYGITVALVNRTVAREEGEVQEEIDPTPDLVLQQGDLIIVTGKRNRIDEFERAYA